MGNKDYCFILYREAICTLKCEGRPEDLSDLCGEGIVHDDSKAKNSALSRITSRRNRRCDSSFESKINSEFTVNFEM